jgi:hypothetical protein
VPRRQTPLAISVGSVFRTAIGGRVREHAREWVEGYRHAWEAGDVDAFLELFTEDVRYCSHPFREPHLGHEGLRAYAAGSPDQADVEVLVGEPVVDGDWHETDEARR